MARLTKSERIYRLCDDRSFTERKSQSTELMRDYTATTCKIYHAPTSIKSTRPVQAVNFSDVVEHIKALGAHIEHFQPIDLTRDGDFVDITSGVFPMYVPVIDYIGSLRINELERFEVLEEQGGVNLAKFDLQRGVIITVKFAGLFDFRYADKLKAIRNAHLEFQPILDPILYSYPNEDEGDEPTGELAMIYDGREVRIAGLVEPWYKDQEKIQFYETLNLGKALSLLELVDSFAAIATDNDTRPLNY